MVHSHTIDDSDRIKINSYLRPAVAIAIEATEGYMGAEVYKNLRSVQLMLASIGEYMDRPTGHIHGKLPLEGILRIQKEVARRKPTNLSEQRTRSLRTMGNVRSKKVLPGETFMSEVRT